MSFRVNQKSLFKHYEKYITLLLPIKQTKNTGTAVLNRLKINSIFSSYKTAENKGSTYGDLITLKNNNSNKSNHIYLWHLEEKCMIPPRKGNVKKKINSS